MPSVHAIVNRVRAEFLEMPGLRLSAEQIQRLCGIEEHLCVAVLDALVEARFLSANANGTYTRATEGPFEPRMQPARGAVNSCRLF